ncbi:MAG TPA: SDR family NAD(P)-dependent oxidoreductase [Longimicrobiales bacterium]|nr:SDR family NAD(P)-dependent oxidoreductase [Longimicrobiales bacterium]
MTDRGAARSVQTDQTSERWLAGRHAIVTGGGRGIGAAIANELARRGATVTITGRDLDRLRDTAQELSGAHGVMVAALVCDITDADSVRSVFATAQREHGDAYILVNNAGQSEGRPFLDTSRELWERMLAVNLTGAFTCTQQVLGSMQRAREGRIVNIASTSGLKGYRNITAYCASKHGLVGLTRALAAETARAGITVNAVCPAYTDTDMAARAVSNVVRDMDRTEDEARALIARSVPRGTLITPAEVAGAVAWLCSPGATGISGQAITIAGGEI